MDAISELQAVAKIRAMILSRFAGLVLLAGLGTSTAEARISVRRKSLVRNVYAY